MEDIVDTIGTSPHRASRTLWDRLETPTWIVFLSVYVAYTVLITFGSQLPWWLFCPAGAVIVAWHGSFQHELIHGHPTRSRFVNELLGWAPLGLWMPYHVYRDSHLAHHRADVLAEPGTDPESYYHRPDDWARMGPVLRGLLIVNNTYLGRVTIGPAIAIIRFFYSELRLVMQGEFKNVPGWGFHIVLSAVLLAGLATIFHIPVWYYCVGVVYPSISLILTRSYLEHRPSEIKTKRTVVVEGGWFWSLLFMSVNFHVTHHEHPGEPWYRVPGIYRCDFRGVAERNGGYIYSSYGNLIWRHLMRPKDVPVYR